MGTNYRLKPTVHSNVYPDVRISGMFAINDSTAALGTIVRPSAGSQASAGAGELFTVTVPTAGTFQYLVTLTEQYFAPVWVRAQVMLVPPSSATNNNAPAAPGTPVKNNANNSQVTAFVTMVDVPIETGNTGGFGSNSFYITLADGAGLVPSSALNVPSGYTVQIGFEACFKNSVSPSTR